jgi:hypothetical protein
VTFLEELPRNPLGTVLGRRLRNLGWRCMMHNASRPTISLSPAVLRTHVMHTTAGLRVKIGRVAICTTPAGTGATYKHGRARRSS